MAHGRQESPGREKLLITEYPVILVGGGEIALSHLIALGGRGHALHEEGDSRDAHHAGGLPLVAADSGADAIALAGLRPDLVIGDFDSVSPELRRRLPAGIFHEAEDPDHGDCAKALAVIESPLIIGLGFFGKRIDHALAALAAMAAYPNPVLFYGAHDAVFHVKAAAGEEVVLQLEKGARVSIWPSGRQGFATSGGLAYPLDGLTIAGDMRGGCLGTSNMVNAEDGIVVLRLAEAKQGAEGGDEKSRGFFVMLDPAQSGAAMRFLAPDYAADFALPIMQ